jgi:hypothetical protein
MPDSATLDPLHSGTDLTDVSQHPAYIQDERTGTFKTSKEKFDYLLLSPELFGALTVAGLNARWRPTLTAQSWPPRHAPSRIARWEAC